MYQTTKIPPTEKQKALLAKIGYSESHCNNMSRKQAGFLIGQQIDEWIQAKAEALYAKIKARRSVHGQA